jgi:hypothetical protein
VAAAAEQYKDCMSEGRIIVIGDVHGQGYLYRRVAADDAVSTEVGAQLPFLSVAPGEIRRLAQRVFFATDLTVWVEV